MDQKLLIGPGIIAIGLLLHTVGQATPYWDSFVYDDSSVNLGLWEVCNTFGCNKIQMNSPILTPLYHASRAFAIMGVLSGAAAVLTIFLYVFQVKLIYVKISAALGAASGVLIAICAIVWFVYAVDMYPVNVFGYSFILSCVGSVLSIKGSIASYVMVRRHHRFGYATIVSP
ncbi:uncharacterized protein LOC131943672 [Physella acuta]|uniref:uncharacterized protein LOC131943672 n=1 Tax=Physella acuta TaxID=109671 RepID=UPI0027DAB5CD|nr:uncharacterized protein LOC131943672 [Physella acuta]XP_059159868.1 uncharacterized protein LOC131943672 [Physella acuta]